jgi:hypothetical protein
MDDMSPWFVDDEGLPTRTLTGEADEAANVDADGRELEKS